MTHASKSKLNRGRAVGALWVTFGALFWMSCLARHEGPTVSDTATNWLRACDSNSECGGGSACLQHVCTLSCRPPNQSLCLALDDRARCLPEAGDAALCDLPCSGDADCTGFRPDYACTAGRCRERAAAATTVTAEVRLDGGGPAADASQPVEDASVFLADAATPLMPVSQHPGCTTEQPAQLEYEDQEALEAVLVGRWAPCMPTDEPGYGFEGEEAGVEFAAGGKWYGLSEVNGQIVRNQASGTWTFLPPDRFLIDALQTNAPFITSSPRSAAIGVDPRFPRYVPLTR